MLILFLATILRLVISPAIAMMATLPQNGPRKA
jgi:hypothetical protein